MDMAEKLQEKNTETRSRKISLICGMVGVWFLFCGVLCLIIKAVTGSYVDASGMLHEYFFFIPMAYVFFIAGIVLLIVAGVKKAVRKRGKKK